MGQFSEKIKESTQPREKTTVRTGSDFIKLSTEHTTIVRIVDPVPEISWSHFVPKKHTAFPDANNSKGMSFICPGRDAGCPICEWNKNERAKSKEEKPKNLLNSRKVYTFNVLDRTSIVRCPECGWEHYEGKSGFPEECSNPDCKVSVVDIESGPRNKVQVMQKGIRIAEQFIAFEDEFGDVTSYDIKLDTRGTGDKSSTICVPKPPVELNLAEILGEDWKEHIYNIKEITKPMEVENIKRILAGEDYFSVFGKK